MIQGLLVKISGEELHDLLVRSAKDHQIKADAYWEQASKMPEGSEFASNDPVAAAKARAKDHREKAAYFTFLANHIEPSESYRLNAYELKEIGAV